MNGCLFRTVKARHHPVSLLALFRRSDDSAHSSSSSAATTAAQLQQLYDVTRGSGDAAVASTSCALLLHKDEHIANVREQVSLKLRYTTPAAGTTTAAASANTASTGRRSLIAGGRASLVNKLTTTAGNAATGSDDCSCIMTTVTTAGTAVTATAGKGEYVGDARIRVLFSRTGLRSTAQGFEVVPVPSLSYTAGMLSTSYTFIHTHTRSKYVVDS
jgi:hypothetical protein